MQEIHSNNVKTTICLSHMPNSICMGTAASVGSIYRAAWSNISHGICCMCSVVYTIFNIMVWHFPHYCVIARPAIKPIRLSCNVLSCNMVSISDRNAIWKMNLITIVNEPFMRSVRALLCFSWLSTERFYLYSLGLLDFHWGNYTFP